MRLPARPGRSYFAFNVFQKTAPSRPGMWVELYGAKPTLSNRGTAQVRLRPRQLGVTELCDRRWGRAQGYTGLAHMRRKGSVRSVLCRKYRWRLRMAGG
jgi:hypothetical protein